MLEDPVLAAAEREACAESVEYWIAGHGWLEDPHAAKSEERELPLILWPRQVELVRFLSSGIAAREDRILNKARKIGATWIALHVVLHRWLFERDFTAKLGSRKQESVDDFTRDSLFGKLRYIVDRQPRFLLPGPGRLEDSSRRLKNLENGSEIIGEATNRNFGRGGRRTVVVFDEFAHVDPAIQDAARRSLESVAASVWMISTPNGRGNRFHVEAQLASASQKLELDWRADPTKTEEWFEGLLRENGGSLTWDEREQERNCSFAGVTGLRVVRFERDRVLYTDQDLPEGAREHLWLSGGMDFGSGPSLTVCLLALIDWPADRGESPTIWVDRELFFQREPVASIGADIVNATSLYGNGWALVGDPAGRNKESDQESWESNLRRAGVPLTCLDAEYNDPHLISETLGNIETLAAEGRLRIHERCTYLLECLEAWTWDVPAGIPLELVNRQQIKPRKDQWSHGGDALRYLVGAAVRMSRFAFMGPGPDLSDVELGPGAQLGDAYDRWGLGGSHTGGMNWS